MWVILLPSLAENYGFKWFLNRKVISENLCVVLQASTWGVPEAGTGTGIVAPDLRDAADPLPLVAGPFRRPIVAGTSSAHFAEPVNIVSTMFARPSFASTI